MSGEFSIGRNGRWEKGALCAQTDPELFYPEGGGRISKLAKDVCNKCEVRPECTDNRLKHAAKLQPHEVYGYEAGMTPSEVNRALGRPERKHIR